MHLWLLPTDGVEADRLCAEGRHLLSPDERDRYRSFGHPARARRFLLGRILLRHSLATHTGMTAAELRFCYGPNGKPEVMGGGAGGPAFSLSHGQTMVVVAVALADAVGVDLEPLSRAPTVQRIARRFFSETELVGLGSQGASAGRDAIAFWGLKESIIKAVGGTVWDGLSGVELSLEGGRISWLSRPPEGREANWLLVCGRYPAGSSLALALKQEDPITRPQEVVVHVMESAPGTTDGLEIDYVSGPITTRSVCDRSLGPAA